MPPGEVLGMRKESGVEGCLRIQLFLLIEKFVAYSLSLAAVHPP